MNFCSDCGKDLRIAHEERFCSQCGREFLAAPHVQHEISECVRPDSNAESYEKLRSLLNDLAVRFSYNSTPPDVANYHGCSPVDVSEDSDFQTFPEGSVSIRSTRVAFEYPDCGFPIAQLWYKFEDKDYSFYNSYNNVLVKGLSTIGLITTQTFSRIGLHEALGAPTNSRMLDNFDRVDDWELKTPRKGKEPEKIVAYYEATNSTLAANIWLSFPEF